jgi:hypothetical protein
LAGTDFFTAEVLTLRGLVTYYVLFFIHLESRQVDIAGITIHPDEPWVRQIARNVTVEGCGVLRDCRYLLHDRDTKYTQSFRTIIASGRVEPLALPARSPNLNACAERWVRSVSEREIVHAIARYGETAISMPVSEILRHAVITVSPTDTVSHVMRLMTRHRVRHMPVLRDGNLVGIISIGDVVKHRLEDLELETNVLRDVYNAAR